MRQREEVQALLRAEEDIESRRSATLPVGRLVPGLVTLPPLKAPEDALFQVLIDLSQCFPVRQLAKVCLQDLAGDGFTFL